MHRMSTVRRGNSSVGRAQPCQGWGREFESRFPLQIRNLGSMPGFFRFSRNENDSRILYVCDIGYRFGWVAEWLCSGLQSRGRRFDSGLSLHQCHLMC